MRGKMLRALRRDCWGCDNRVRAAGWWGPCTCSTPTTDRTKEKRQWKKEIHDY